MMLKHEWILTGTIFVALCCLDVRADNWSNWRGPTGQGVAEPGDYPTEWTNEQNVRWSVALPGPGSSTPAVWNDRIFVTCQSGDANAVVCLDWNGQEIWTQTVGLYVDGKHKKATGANPSVVTDGQHVVAYFKSGDLACFDFSGQQFWHTNLQQRFAEDTLWWDLGTSPVLVDDRVVVAVMQSDESYVAAFRVGTGDVAWKVDRNLQAPLEANHSYTTPVVVPQDGSSQLILLGADHITAHDARDGHEVWRMGGLNPEQSKIFRVISSPVCSGDMLFTCYARGGAIMGVRLGGQGDVTDTHVAWNKWGEFSDVPTPTVDDRNVYICSDRGQIYCFDKASGEERWTQRLPRTRHAFSASPIRAGSLLYVTSENGTTYVLDLDKNGELIATNELDELIVASPVLVRNQILMRTLTRLYCIAAEGGSGASTR